MRNVYLRRICIIALPSAFALAAGALVSAYAGFAAAFQICAALASAWFLICALVFARPRERAGEAENAKVSRDAQSVKIPDKPEVIVRDPVAASDGARREYGGDLMKNECRRAIEDVARLADNAALTKAECVIIKNLQSGITSLEGFEASLRKAISMCEDVTNEVYIMSVLANVEVGAHMDSIAGFEVIAKQIQPLAESGSMAAIEAKASLDSAFAPLEGMRESISQVLRKISLDDERRQKLLARIGEAERAVDRLTGSASREEK